MPIDAAIPLSVQPTNPMQTVSSLLDVKSKINAQQLQQQAMQSNAMANQQSQIDLQETQNAQKVVASAPRDADGNIDLGKVSPLMAQAAPKNYATFMSNLASAQQSANVAKQSWLNATDTQRTQFGKIATSLVGQSPEVVMKTMDAVRSSPAFSNMTPSIDHFVQTAIAPAAQKGDQKGLDDGLYRIGKMAEAPSTQQAMNTPGGVGVDNGQQFGTVSTKPGTTVPQGQTIPGTEGTHQLPPTTPIVNADTSQGYLGPQGPGGPAVFDMGSDRTANLQMLNSVANDPKQPPDIRQQARAQLQQVSTQPRASLPVGQAQNIANNVDEMNRHFGSLQDQAAGTQLVTGLTGNIKALADKAATGTGGGYKALASGLLQAMHIPSTGDEKTDTDLLEKNMAQLNLGTPASSDAARTLVAAARPHSTMSAQAIKDAADQVASQVQANMAIRNMLAPAKQMGDVQTYNTQRQKLESIADPRAWQYVNLGPGSQAAKDFMAKLQPADKAALIQKVDQLEQMGMLK